MFPLCEFLINTLIKISSNKDKGEPHQHYTNGSWRKDMPVDILYIYCGGQLRNSIFIVLRNLTFYVFVHTKSAF